MIPPGAQVVFNVFLFLSVWDTLSDPICYISIQVNVGFWLDKKVKGVISCSIVAGPGQELV